MLISFQTGQNLFSAYNLICGLELILIFSSAYRSGHNQHDSRSLTVYHPVDFQKMRKNGNRVFNLDTIYFFCPFFI